jgi:hypothetical protein
VTVLDEMIASLEASAPGEDPGPLELSEEVVHALLADDDGICHDLDCWRCHSPLCPDNLRRLAKNLASAAMLCRAWQQRDEDPSWRPGCNIERAKESP